jgi:hypothetical protein
MSGMQTARTTNIPETINGAPMDHTEELSTTIGRLAAAAAALEQLATRLTENDEATITRIVAQIEDRRESELEQKLAAAEQRIAELEAGAPSKLGLGGIAATEDGCPTSRRDVGSRKTIPTAMTNLLAKQGVAIDSIEAGTLDAALAGLSLEQRFAVKAQLLRAGLLS